MLCLPWREREYLEVRGRRVVADETHDAATTCDMDTTGSLVWDAAQHLLDYVERNRERLDLSHVVELGAGTGAMAVALAWLGAGRVTATDLPHAVPRIGRTVALNEGAAGVVASCELAFGDAEVAARLRPCSLAVASDVVYSAAMVEPVCATLEALACPALLCTRVRSEALLQRLEERLPRGTAREEAGREHVIHLFLPRSMAALDSSPM